MLWMDELRSDASDTDFNCRPFDPNFCKGLHSYLWQGALPDIDLTCSSGERCECKTRFNVIFVVTACQTQRTGYALLRHSRSLFSVLWRTPQSLSAGNSGLFSETPERKFCINNANSTKNKALR